MYLGSCADFSLTFDTYFVEERVIHDVLFLHSLHSSLEFIVKHIQSSNSNAKLKNTSKMQYNLIGYSSACSFA